MHEIKDESNFKMEHSNELCEAFDMVAHTKPTTELNCELKWRIALLNRNIVHCSSK